MNMVQVILYVLLSWVCRLIKLASDRVSRLRLVQDLEDFVKRRVYNGKIWVFCSFVAI